MKISKKVEREDLHKWVIQLFLSKIKPGGDFMNEKLKKFSLVLVVGLVLAFTAGITTQGVRSAFSKEELKGELTIAVWGDIGANPKHGSYGFHLLCQDWAKANPGVTLKYEINPGKTVPDRYTWIRTRMMAKALPDVVMVYWGSEETRDAKFMHDFTPDLGKANPYSTNPTWRDDFPGKGSLLEEFRLPTGEFTVVGPTQYGDAAVTCVIYNKTIFDKVGLKIPNTWSEFIEVQKKLKAAGYTPFFHPTAGPSGWLLQWPSYQLTDDLLDEVIKKADHKIDESDVGQPNGMISLKEMCWAIKTGLLKATDPRYAEVWRIMKDWSKYWQEGFLAPPPPGDPFLRQEAVMQHHMNLWNARYEDNPEVKFEWGTFSLPKLDKNTSKYANGIFRCVGSGGRAGSVSQLVMIPNTTIEKGNFKLALDLCQFITAPKNVANWCQQQPLPCFEPGTSIQKIFPNDPVKQTHYYGFFQNGCLNMGHRLFQFQTLSPDTEIQSFKVAQEYLGDKINLEETMKKMQNLIEREVDKKIRQHPEWKAENWK
jgi:raffinose/stachyose/melibiose transport system substrate-binding protein